MAPKSKVIGVALPLFDGPSNMANGPMSADATADGSLFCFYTNKVSVLNINIKFDDD
jgi:hypothetical protein